MPHHPRSLKSRPPHPHQPAPLTLWPWTEGAPLSGSCGVDRGERELAWAGQGHQPAQSVPRPPQSHLHEGAHEEVASHAVVRVTQALASIAQRPGCCGLLAGRVSDAGQVLERRCRGMGGGQGSCGWLGLRCRQFPSPGAVGGNGVSKRPEGPRAVPGARPMAEWGGRTHRG